MKQLPLVIAIVVMALLTFVTGCGRAPRYDARLVAADSLMRDFPDSALAVVEAVSPGSLGGEGDRAYRSLLLTQARYRCYITATTDSDINRALAYYRRHSGEREKLTRAYIYKGAVMEELGHPDSAMLYYKHAEATAAPDDHFNLGYTNLRIAQLYQSFYANSNAVISRMKMANMHFRITHDTLYLITALGTQGGYVRLLGKDSARMYLEQAIYMAKQVKSASGLQYQSKLAGTYFYDGDYRRAKDLAMEIVMDKKREECNESQFYYYAARSYIHLGLLDSARWLMTSVIPAPMFAVDSMNHFQTMADISLAEHRYGDYRIFSEKAKTINLRLVGASRESTLTQTELMSEASHREEKLENQYNSSLIAMMVYCFVGFVTIIFLCRIVITRISRRYRIILERTREELLKTIAAYEDRTAQLQTNLIANGQMLADKNRLLQEMEKKNRQLQSKQSDFSKCVSQAVRYRHKAFRELYDDLRVAPETGTNGRPIPLFSMIKDLNENKRILSKSPKPSFWNNLRLSVDQEYDGIASFVETNYPNLSIADQHLFWLLCARVPNPIIKLCMNFTNDRTVSNSKKRLINEKMGLRVKLDDFISDYLRQKQGTKGT